MSNSATPVPVAVPVGGSSLVWLMVVLIVFAVVVVLLPWVLTWRFKPHWVWDPDRRGRRQYVGSLFEIPYVTWYLLHLGFGALGIFVVALLALDGVLDNTAIAALLGSLFGYVLGSSSGRSQQRSSSSDVAQAQSAAEHVVPSQGPAAGGTRVALIGRDISAATKVVFGAAEGTDLTPAGSDSLLVTTPPGQGAVDVMLTLPNGTQVTAGERYTYQ
jgi:hypothetical protein